MHFERALDQNIFEKRNRVSLHTAPSVFLQLQRLAPNTRTNFIFEKYPQINYLLLKSIPKCELRLSAYVYYKMRQEKVSNLALCGLRLDIINWYFIVTLQEKIRGKCPYFLISMAMQSDFDWYTALK